MYITATNMDKFPHLALPNTVILLCNTFYWISGNMWNQYSIDIFPGWSIHVLYSKSFIWYNSINNVEWMYTYSYKMYNFTAIPW